MNQALARLEALLREQLPADVAAKALDLLNEAMYEARLDGMEAERQWVNG